VGPVIREFGFAVYLITTLEITGVIGMSFRAGWFVDSLHSMGLYVPHSPGEFLMALMNVALFVPLGIFLPLVFRRGKLNWRKMLVAGLGFSAGIEFLQMFGGRMAEVDDVLFNVAGSMAGYAALRVGGRIKRRIAENGAVGRGTARAGG
jgi:glycopeptide antibiotics resistance protein